jgi:hypothetical protein
MVGPNERARHHARPPQVPVESFKMTLQMFKSGRHPNQISIKAQQFAYCIVLNSSAESKVRMETLVYMLSMAFLTAARASNRVESSVGSGELSGVTSSGISVHPNTTASHP